MDQVLGGAGRQYNASHGELVRAACIDWLAQLEASRKAACEERWMGGGVAVVGMRKCAPGHGWQALEMCRQGWRGNIVF